MGKTDAVFLVGAKETMPDEWPVKLEFDHKKKLQSCEAPTGTLRDQGTLAAIATWGAKTGNQCPAFARGKKQDLNSLAPKPIYMDCGRWGGGGSGCKFGAQRNFGLICGRYVAVCDATFGMGPLSMPAPPNIDNGLIDKFLKHMHQPGASGNTQMVTVIKHMKVGSDLAGKLTSKSLYLLFPDLHLPVVVNQPATKTIEVWEATNWAAHKKKIQVVNDGQPSMGRAPYSVADNISGAESTRWFKQYFAGDIFGKQAAGIETGNN